MNTRHSAAVTALLSGLGKQYPGGMMMTGRKLIVPVTITLAVIALAVAGHGRSEESARGVTPLGNGFTYTSSRPEALDT